MIFIAAEIGGTFRIIFFAESWDKANAMTPSGMKVVCGWKAEDFPGILFDTTENYYIK